MRKARLEGWKSPKWAGRQEAWPNKRRDGEGVLARARKRGIWWISLYRSPPSPPLHAGAARTMPMLKRTAFLVPFLPLPALAATLSSTLHHRAVPSQAYISPLVPILCHANRRPDVGVRVLSRSIVIHVASRSARLYTVTQNTHVHVSRFRRHTKKFRYCCFDRK